MDVLNAPGDSDPCIRTRNDAHGVRAAIVEAARLLARVEIEVQQARTHCPPGIDEYYLGVMAERLRELQLISDWLRQPASRRVPAYDGVRREVAF